VGGSAAYVGMAEGGGGIIAATKETESQDANTDVNHILDDWAMVRWQLLVSFDLIKTLYIDVPCSITSPACRYRGDIPV
jgi:hypothetical protein